MAAERPQPHTSLATDSSDTITVVGKDLPTELMGHVHLGDMAFLVVAGRLPSPPESRLFNAALVALCEHGMTPMAITSRLTLTSAPESIQGAIAAGLLGVGDRFLGVVENTARMLTEGIRGVDRDDEAALSQAGRRIVESFKDAAQLVPGLGHRFHKGRDPRTVRLYELADEEDLLGPHLRLLQCIREQAEEVHGKSLPINGAGACGAVFADLGFNPSIIRGFAVLSRATGLVGHLWEESQNPIGRVLLDMVRNQVTYKPPSESRDS